VAPVTESLSAPSQVISSEVAPALTPLPSLIEAVSPVVTTVVAPLSSLTETITPLAGTALNPLTEPVTQIVSTVATPLTSLAKTVTPVVANVLTPLTESVLPVVSTVLTPLTTVTEAVSPVIVTVLTPVTSITNLINPVVSDVVSVISPLTTELVELPQTLLPGVLTPVLETVSDGLVGVVSAIAPLTDVVTDTLTATVSIVTPLTTTLTGLTQEVLGGAIQVVSLGTVLNPLPVVTPVIGQLPGLGTLPGALLPEGSFLSEVTGPAGSGMTNIHAVVTVPQVQPAAAVPTATTPANMSLLPLLAQTQTPLLFFPNLSSFLPTLLQPSGDSLDTASTITASNFVGSDEAAILAGFFGTSGLVEQEEEIPADDVIARVELSGMEFLTLPEEVEEAGILDLSALEMAGLATIAAPLALSALAQALEDFLAEATRTYRTLLGWLEQLGPWPWLLMSLAVAAALQQYLRWRLRQTREQVAWAAEPLLG
jgi:hypothetical protein